MDPEPMSSLSNSRDSGGRPSTSRNSMQNASRRVGGKAKANELGKSSENPRPRTPRSGNRANTSTPSNTRRRREDAESRWGGGHSGQASAVDEFPRYRRAIMQILNRPVSADEKVSILQEKMRERLHGDLVFGDGRPRMADAFELAQYRDAIDEQQKLCRGGQIGSSFTSSAMPVRVKREKSQGGAISQQGRAPIQESTSSGPLEGDLITPSEFDSLAADLTLPLSRENPVPHADRVPTQKRTPPRYGACPQTPQSKLRRRGSGDHVVTSGLVVPLPPSVPMRSDYQVVTTGYEGAELEEVVHNLPIPDGPLPLELLEFPLNLPSDNSPSTKASVSTSKPSTGTPDGGQRHRPRASPQGHQSVTASNTSRSIFTRNANAPRMQDGLQDLTRPPTRRSNSPHEQPRSSVPQVIAPQSLEPSLYSAPPPVSQFTTGTMQPTLPPSQLGSTYAASTASAPSLGSYLTSSGRAAGANRQQQPVQGQPGTSTESRLNDRFRQMAAWKPPGSHPAIGHLLTGQSLDHSKAIGQHQASYPSHQAHVNMLSASARGASGLSTALGHGSPVGCKTTHQHRQRYGSILSHPQGPYPKSQPQPQPHDPSRSRGSPATAAQAQAQAQASQSVRAQPAPHQGSSAIPLPPPLPPVAIRRSTAHSNSGSVGAGAGASAGASGSGSGGGGGLQHQDSLLGLPISPFSEEEVDVMREMFGRADG